MGSTYSFLDIQAAIYGPGGAFSVGAGSENSEEGITIDPVEDINTMTIGADGGGMHSLHANKSGRVVIRLLKTSPVNALMSALYNVQTASGSTHGRNTITIVNTTTGDVITCQRCGFKKAPTIVYAKIGGMNEWEFDSIQIDRILGALNIS